MRGSHLNEHLKRRGCWASVGKRQRQDNTGQQRGRLLISLNILLFYLAWRIFEAQFNTKAAFSAAFLHGFNVFLIP